MASGFGKVRISHVRHDLRSWDDLDIELICSLQLSDGIG